VRAGLGRVAAFAALPIRVTPDPRRESPPLFLREQCDRTPGKKGKSGTGAYEERAAIPEELVRDLYTAFYPAG
jgi:hypothetical protein